MTTFIEAIAPLYDPEPEADEVAPCLQSLVERQSHWEDELDMVGAVASQTELRSLMDRAPDPVAPASLYLLQCLNESTSSPWAAAA